MEPLLHDLPVDYLRQLPPDLLERAIRVQPLCRLYGPKAAVLKPLWEHEAQPRPRETYVIMREARTRATFSGAPARMPSVTDVVRENGLLSFVLVEQTAGGASSATLWKLLGTATPFPEALGLLLLYESYSRRTTGAHETAPTAIAWDEKWRGPENVGNSQYRPRYVTLNESAIVKSYSSQSLVHAERCFTVFLDRVVQLAVQCKDIAVAIVTGGTHLTPRPTLYLNKRGNGQAEVLRAIDRANVSLFESPLWLAWLQPLVHAQLADVGISVEDSRLVTESSMTINIVRRGDALLPAPERIPVPWDVLQRKTRHLFPTLRNCGPDVELLMRTHALVMRLGDEQMVVRETRGAPPKTHGDGVACIDCVRLLGGLTRFLHLDNKADFALSKLHHCLHLVLGAPSTPSASATTSETLEIAGRCSASCLARYGRFSNNVLEDVATWELFYAPTPPPPWSNEPSSSGGDDVMSE